MAISIRSSGVHTTGSSSWFANTTPKTSTITWLTGDVVVLLAVAENAGTTLNTPTATGLTFTLRQTSPGTGTGNAQAKVWTAKAAGAGTAQTLSLTRGTPAINFGFYWWVLAGANDYNTGGNSGGLGGISLTTTAGAFVVYGLGDWSASALNPSADTGSGTATERVDIDDAGGSYGIYIYDWLGAAAGTFTFGLTPYTGMAPNAVAIAVSEAAGGTAYDQTPADPVGVTDSATDVVDAVRSSADPVGVTDTAAAVAASARTPADPVGLTDTVTAELGRAPADAVGVTDAVEISAARASADPIGVTDVATVVATVDRAPADAVGATDAATLLQALARSAGDPVGVTDSATAELGQIHTPADPVGITDTAAVEASAARAAADAVGVTDTATADLTTGGPAPTLLNTFALSSADPHSITITGATAGRDIWLIVNTAAVVTTPAGWTSEASRVVTMASYVYRLDGTSNPGGSIGVTLDLSAARALAAVAIEATTVAAGTLYASLVVPVNGPGSTTWGTGAHTFPQRDDALALYCFHSATTPPTFAAQSYDQGFTALADTGWAGTGGAGDEATRVMVGSANEVGFTAGGVVLTLDAAGPTGSAVGLLAFDVDTSALTGAPADPVGITDTVAAVATVDRAAADPVGVTDSAATLQALARTATDGIGVTDSATAELTGGVVDRTPADPVGVSDSVAAAAAVVRAPADPVGVTDVAATAVAYVRTVADPVGVTDTDSPQTIDIGYDLADPAGVTDTAATVAAVVRAAADPVGITDTAGTALDGSGTIVRTLDDPVGVTDTVAPAVATTRTAADAVGVADAVALAVTRSPADAVGVTDSVARLAALGRQVDDVVGLADTVTVARLTVVTVADAVGVTDDASNAGDSPWFVWRGGALVRHRALLGGVHPTTVDVT